MCESPRISRGENTDQFSIRSSSVLTALRAPNVRFPTLRHALLLTLLLLPACLPTLPTALSRPTSSYEILDAISMYALLFQEELLRQTFFSMLLVGVEPRSLTLEA